MYLEIVKVRGGRSRKEQKKIYRRLLKHTERVVGHFQGHLRKGQQTGAFERIENAVPWARFRAMREEWERLGPLID